MVKAIIWKRPNYDWAYAVVRSYFYTQAKKVKMIRYAKARISHLLK